jgi:hypothetical protein
VTEVISPLPPDTVKQLVPSEYFPLETGEVRFELL